MCYRTGQIICSLPPGNFFLDFFQPFAYIRACKRYGETMLKNTLLIQAHDYFLYFFNFKGFKVCLSVS